MRFICPEIEGIPLEEMIAHLYGTSAEPREYLKDLDGNSLQKLITLTGYKNGSPDKITTLYGRETLAAYFQSSPVLSSVLTIAGWASAAGLTVSTNFTDSASYKFIYRTLLDSEKPFTSSFWWTVFTDDGLYLALPQRRSDAKRIETFEITSSVERSGFFDDADYYGESGASILIDGNFQSAIPLTVNGTQKSRAMNKYLSRDTVLKIRTGAENVRPCDYIIHGGKVFVILSKKDAAPGLWEYVAVLEQTEAHSFSAADEVFIDGSMGAGVWKYYISSSWTFASVSAGTFFPITSARNLAIDYEKTPWMDIATGKFTPKKAGMYRFDFSVDISNLPASSYLEVRIGKNATPPSTGNEFAALVIYNHNSASALRVVAVNSVILEANGSTDWFILAIRTGSVTTPILNGNTWKLFNILQITYLGAK